MMTQKSVIQFLIITIVNFTFAAIGIALGIVIMIKGWGLDPQSYNWIIGGGIVLSVMNWLTILSFKQAYKLGREDE